MQPLVTTTPRSPSRPSRQFPFLAGVLQNADEVMFRRATPTLRRQGQSSRVLPPRCRHWLFSLSGLRGRLIQRAVAADVLAALQFLEEMRHLRMAYGLAGLVSQQVLLGDVGHVGGLRVLGKQVVERLVAAR